jgi:pimeloyl-ACP methyl ester carboxylesterase
MGPMTSPETKYAKAGDLHIAYQVVGDGPIDLLFVPSWFSHLELLWQGPHEERVLSRLASFSRLIVFDPRGTGMSDPVPLAEPPMLEERMDDILAVLHAAGSTCAAVFGAAYGGQLAALFAASHPERVSALALYNASARLVRADDYPIGAPRDIADTLAARIGETWGRPGGLDALPGINDRLKEWLPRYQRSALSPGAAAALYRALLDTDVRDVLPSVRVPTLVVHRKDNFLTPISHGRYLAEHIPGARFVEVPGSDHLWFAEDTTPVLDAVEEFFTGEVRPPSTDRVLATVLFTDIVRSTEIAAEVGDERWRHTLGQHEGLVRRQLDRFNGRLIKTTGDGILATFDGPARGIRAAVAIRDGVRSLGLSVRTGLHTGEIELIGSDVAGIGVNIAARVMSLAATDEVLVSSTVQDLVVGSGITFAERGPHELKGIPGTWRLAAVVG